MNSNSFLSLKRDDTYTENIRTSARHKSKGQQLRNSSQKCYYEGKQAYILNSARFENRRVATIEIIEGAEQVEVLYEQLVFA
ncbi:MAG: hypothetical protein U9P71_01495 [Campylobacterota bacterium]|nr:hypothetical protein [Campylobacterota bacterium]